MTLCILLGIAGTYVCAASVVPFIYDCIAGTFENHQAETILHGEKGYIDLDGYFYRQPIQAPKHIQALSREETPIPKDISVDYELITKFKDGLAVIKKITDMGMWIGLLIL